MYTFLIVIHVIIIILLGVIFLIQVPEGNGMSGLGASQMSNMKNSLIQRSFTANSLNKFMLILIVMFMVSSLSLSGLYTRQVKQESILYNQKPNNNAQDDIQDKLMIKDENEIPNSSDNVNKNTTQDNNVEVPRN